MRLLRIRIEAHPSQLSVEQGASDSEVLERRNPANCALDEFAGIKLLVGSDVGARRLGGFHNLKASHCIFDAIWLGKYSYSESESFNI